MRYPGWLRMRGLSGGSRSAGDDAGGQPGSRLRGLWSPRVWLRLAGGREDGTVAGWFSVTGGPSAWFAAFLINLFLMRGGCNTGAVVARYGVLVLATIVVAAAVMVAWHNWRATQGHRTTEGGEVGIARFTSLYGLILSVLSVLLMIMLFVTTLALDACIHSHLSLGGEQ